MPDSLSRVDLRRLFEEAPGKALTATELRPHASAAHLGRLIGEGLIKYDGRGTYWLPSKVAARHVIARQLRGVLSHRSAAARLGLELTHEIEATEVTVDRRRKRVKAPEGVRVYYRDLRPDECADGVTTVVRTIVDCARDHTAPDALAMADAVVRTGAADLDELADAASRLRGRGSARARRVIGWIDARAASVLESVTRGVLLDGDITGFEPQFPVKISTGQVLHADLGHEEARLLVEAESMLAHTGAGRVEGDAIRYSEFAAAGYTLMRFTWSNVMYRRPWVVQMVRSALEQRTKIDL